MTLHNVTAPLHRPTDIYSFIKCYAIITYDVLTVFLFCRKFFYSSIKQFCYILLIAKKLFTEHWKYVAQDKVLTAVAPAIPSSAAQLCPPHPRCAAFSHPSASLRILSIVGCVTITPTSFLVPPLPPSLHACTGI